MQSVNSNIRISVIGSGYWGKNLVRNFAALRVLHSICDSDEETLARFSSQYQGVEAIDSFSEIILNREISGVVIATPAETHFSLVQEALLADKDVYVEKPLCLSVSEGEILSKLAEERNRILMVGHLLWYHPAIIELKNLIHKGSLGRIQYIYSNRLNLGKLRREENVLWSFAPHDISVILGLVQEMPYEVQALGGNYLHRKIADTTMTLLAFPSGIKAHIFVSWLHPFKEQKLVIVGDKQMAVFDDTAGWDEKLTLYPHSVNWIDNIPVADKAEGVRINLKPEEPLRKECEHFINCMDTRCSPKTDASEGVRVLKVLNACQEAMETGILVNISDQESKTCRKSFFCHDTAIIDKGVEIGADTKIWHFSHLLSGCKLGEACSIGQNVVVGNNVVVGDNCKIQNNVSVYEGVILEDNVFCGPSMVFTNVFNPRCEFPRKNEFKKTLVRRGVTIGANATIVCGVTIGEYSFVGAGAVVLDDVKPYALMVGNPAYQIGWMSRYGKRLELPLHSDGETKCQYTGEVYRVRNGFVEIVDATGK